MKNVLVINSSSPFTHLNGREALDMALIFAAIDQNVSLLFRGAAVLALKPRQQPEEAKLKNYFKTLKTLELYDIENVYVCADSINQYPLDSTDLLLNAKVLNKAEIELLFRQQDHIVTL